MRLKVAVAVAMLAVSLAACGGGSGNSGNSQTSSSSNGSSSPVVPSDTQILADIATSQSTTTNTPIWDTGQRKVNDSYVYITSKGREIVITKEINGEGGRDIAEALDKAAAHQVNQLSPIVR